MSPREQGDQGERGEPHGHARATPEIAARIDRILAATPLIDGHNDLAGVLRDHEGDARWTIDLRDLTGHSERFDTDITRLRAGRVGAQFWSVWVDPRLPGPEQVTRTLEQIDLVNGFVARHADTFALARTAADVRRIHAEGRIASLIGVEGGGQIDANLSVLRAYHALGAGYLTLTHVLTIPWADSATDDPVSGGLTRFGEAVVRELNRLGMLVDLAHVSEAVMRDVLRISRAPVIFSHSNARALAEHPRNASDEVLELLRDNNGVAMVTFAKLYVSDAYNRWLADKAAERTRFNAPPYGGLFVGQPVAAAEALAAWEHAHPAPVVTLSDVADHIEHVARVAGIDHVGIGSDFDGAIGMLPDGLDGVDCYPALLGELMRRGWGDDAIAKLAGENILRVMEQAEQVAHALRGDAPETVTMAAAHRCAAT